MTGNLNSKYKDIIERYVDSIDWLRSQFLEMDSMMDVIMGIRDWDDSVCVEFGNKKLVVSVDGPYTKRLVMKSALVHATTDVVVKGARPLFAMDALIGNEEDIREMAASLKRQALSLKIPILGGNTLVEDKEARCNLTVIGELITEKPIRDSTCMSGDIIVILGEPIWGKQDDRLKKAKNLFSVWFGILNKSVEIHAAKDITKGGLVSTLYEISKKSGLGFDINSDIEFSVTRNLDNFLVFISPEEWRNLLKMCKKKDLSVLRIGRVR
ncbi:MAG TPA: hypothetical protein EYP86_02970 [Candidatus Altiarchaeales archaeon]|nr:hypothetical protein [Candidatus Altiarchaeales archaeon]